MNTSLQKYEIIYIQKKNNGKEEDRNIHYKSLIYNDQFISEN